MISVILVQFLSNVWLMATPWTAAHQASLPFVISQSLFKLMSILLMIPFNHYPPLPPCLPSFNLSQHQGIFPMGRLHIKQPKCWSFSFGISPSNEYTVFIFFRIDWFNFLAGQWFQSVIKVKILRRKHQILNLKLNDSFKSLLEVIRLLGKTYLKLQYA